MLKKITTLYSLPILLVVLSAFLVGCGPKKDDLDLFLAEKRAQPGGRLEPLPEFIPPEPFVYSASGLRSPFQRPFREEEKPTNLAEPPDKTRPKEVLEGFSIDQISMVGTLQGTDGKLWALVSDGAGGVYRVAEGSYLGRNFGKITEVHIDKIEVMEVVPDGSNGWLGRPKSIEIKEK